MNSSALRSASSALVRVDCKASLNEGWAQFHQPKEWIAATNLESVITTLERVEAGVEAGLFAVGYVAFEAAAALDEALACSSVDQSLASSPYARSAHDLPLAGFCLFEKAEPVRLPFAQNENSPPPTWVLEEGESKERYLAAIEEILRGISVGDVYQVNYTFPLLISPPLISLQQEKNRQPKEEQRASSLQLFERLCRAQGGAYACFLQAGDLEICSASPELFFKLHGEQITTQPMKGTAPRGRFLAEDQVIAHALRKSQKDRAENLMIVDMMRNDLGRIAEVGSVKGLSLFDVQRLPTLHQMTSTVQARTNANLASIFAALFPCSSITGAPKSTAMEAIRRLENRARGIYTGAVGVVLPATPRELGLLDQPSSTSPLSPPNPPSRRQPPAPVASSSRRGRRYAQFNVAIRTAWRTHPAEPFHYGVGSGIVWDSRPELEYLECRSKALAITQQTPEFRLLETMLLRTALPHQLASVATSGADTSRADTSKGEPSNPLARIWLLRQHTERLGNSAKYFSFPFDEEHLRRQLLQSVSVLSPNRRYRLRLLLDASGALEIQPSLEPRKTRRVLRVALASRPVDASDPFLFHKTTRRAVYQEVLNVARKRHGGIIGDGNVNLSADRGANLADVILYNQDGELTESCFANLILEPVAKGEPWRTPPQSSGLLAGTLRQALLERGRIVECPLRKKDLLEASSPLLINSVRGFLPFEIVELS